MSVAFDPPGSSNPFGAVSATTWTHTTTSADCAIVHSCVETVSAYGTITARWNSTSAVTGTAMAEIASGPSQANDGTFFEQASLYFITAASISISGPQSVFQDFSRNAFGDDGASTWLGAHQTTPLINRQVEQGAGANSNIPVPTTVSTSQIIDAFVSVNGPVNYTQTKTSLFKGGSGVCGAAQYTAGTGGTVNMDMTFAAAVHAHLAAEIQVPAAGGGAVRARTRSLLGVGL